MSKLLGFWKGEQQETGQSVPTLHQIKLMQTKCCTIRKENWKCAGENRIQVERIGYSVELIQTERSRGEQ